MFGAYSIRFEIGGGALVAKIGIVKTANISTINKADDRLQPNLSDRKTSRLYKSA
ncbi:hypothetical protein ACF3DV_20520 [Chlorogloeopsis fritschii PCC 9212]|uniref:Uncharacterized protein n=1 Tax=Chlorogloeopsis fritschii PCC 6912 TaxID=211165 RepID=A0A3S0YHM1_CHLFR|nr:hypothetical protein [Chlorogloeopsis fritschii]MBF2004036.1 hypothetical protein [Chlorogloeopsis fritschii C42_A2020_084]RUR84688.1 hypothetical protein PCC6912_15830 [Chlorogloeopsis fritschii PCC 6912]